MSLTAGSRLGPYAVIAKLGEGGMGEVYRARDTRLDRDVALKILPRAFTAEPDRRARFEREAKAVAALSHPNILAIFDVGECDGVFYAATELLEGQTLRDRLSWAHCRRARPSNWPCRSRAASPRPTTAASCIAT